MPLHGPTASELLAIWEAAAAEDSIGRGTAMLTTATEVSPSDATHLPLGERDGRLLVLRERLFGPTAHGVAPCPSCRERLEVSFSTAQVPVAPAGATEEAVEVDGFRVEFRLPTALDLGAAARESTVEEARARLLRACVLEVRQAGRALSVEDAPARAVDEVVAAMAAADPQADVRLAVTCPACGERATLVFDVSAFLWAEIDGISRRLLLEVHALASAYGWAEAEILAMSPQRRGAYLDLLES